VLKRSAGGITCAKEMVMFIDSAYVLVAVMAIAAILTMIHAMRRGTPGHMEHHPGEPGPNRLPWPVVLALLVCAMVPIGLVALLLHLTGRL
jgi:hypothetical protein